MAMINRTPFLKGFGPLLFGKAPRRAIEKLRELQSLEDLYSTFGNLIDDRFWKATDQGINRRKRLLPDPVIFWAFVSQVLNPGSSCREMVRRIEVWWRWMHFGSQQTVTAASYCRARQRLSLSILELIGDSIALQIEKKVLSKDEWIKGRSVKIVDGTMLSMPDTAALQERWPQHKKQLPGCGFPLLKLVSIFSLSSGACLASAQGNKYDSEPALFKSLWNKLQRGDILLEDRGFCSYASMSSLLQRGIDTVSRLHQGRKEERDTDEVLAPGDRLITWKKPKKQSPNYTAEQWAAVPESLSLRQIQIVVQVKGFRTQQITLVTTLCDPVKYPAEKIRELYRERWQVELHFAQIKTILGMDVLRCQSPEMIEKEIQIHLIAYNLIRALMQRSAQIHEVNLQRISFKGSLDALRQYAPLIHQANKNQVKQRQLIEELLAAIAKDLLPVRPNRHEPRVKKRRAKAFNYMTRPRRNKPSTPLEIPA